MYEGEKDFQKFSFDVYWVSLWLIAWLGVHTLRLVQHTQLLRIAHLQCAMRTTKNSRNHFGSSSSHCVILHKNRLTSKTNLQHFVVNQISCPRKGMLSPWPLGIAVGVTAAVGYCVYFDHKRRSDPNFRQKVRERRARAAQAANRASGMPDASDPAAVQRYFMTELQVRNVSKRTLVVIWRQPVLGRGIDWLIDFFIASCAHSIVRLIHWFIAVGLYLRTC